LVVGSPGAGTTVLLADWFATHPERTSAWLCCDAADADPVRFVAGVVEATRRAAGRPNLGEDARQLLSVDRRASADVVAALADDLERFGAPEVLVVDDFHLTGAAGAEVLSLLLDYQPPGLQVVVVSRLEPAIRLHRMRTSEALIEVCDQDLSFSVDETGLFLSEFGIRLTHEELEVVQQRSEGWVAGLQMAAISMHHAPDARGVADRVEIARHTVAGYFLDEVLYRQPGPVVEFMLATSVLDDHHLISESVNYPPSEFLGALVGAGLQARQLGAATRADVHRLPDPLTEAELRVLNVLPQRLTYADIAHDLHLSLNTVKTHLRHTYMKLGVTSRSAAVRRAASLGFI
jgi:ATP/maltotriose-dependent transcriptional regulator MalT